MLPRQPVAQNTVYGLVDRMAEHGATRQTRQERISADMRRLMARPIPTGLSVLAEKVGSPTLQAVADFIRPAPEDIASMPGPLAIGEFSAKGARLLPKVLDNLLKARSGHTLTRARGDFEDWLSEEFDPVLVGVTPLSSVIDPLAQKSIIENFLRTLTDAPKGSLARASGTYLSVRPATLTASVSGQYDPLDQGIRVAARVIPSNMTESAAQRVNDHVSRTLMHEFAHSLSDTPTPYQEVLRYLDDVGWGYFDSKLDHPAKSDIVRGQQHAPSSFWSLFQTQYPTWPADARPTQPVPKYWAMVPDPHKSNQLVPYGSVHPIEDIAEAGAYALLDSMPSHYAQSFPQEVAALKADPRYNLIRKLLQSAGVEIR